MKKHIQISLTVAALLYLVWAISFLIMPEEAHFQFSTGRMDEGIMAMFAACLLAFAVIFLLAVNNPSDDMVQVSAIGLGTIAVVAAYQMFIGDGINRNFSTVLSLVATAGLAAYLFIGSTDGMMNMSSGGKAKRKAPKKTAKKKVTKKAKTKKKAVKRRAR